MCLLGDHLKGLALGTADFRELDHGSGRGFGVEVDHSPVRPSDLPGLADDKSLFLQAGKVPIEFLRPIRHMLKTLASSGQKVATHRRGVVPLLDQFDLQWAGVREGDACHHVRRLAVRSEIFDRGLFEIEEWANPEHLDPVFHRGSDIPNHISVLTNLAEISTHSSSLLPASFPRSSRFFEYAQRRKA